MSEPLQTLSVGASYILGRSLSSSELDAFAKYLDLLQKWQKVQRLVGSVEPRWVVENLFLDSLLFLRVLPTNAAVVADLGSGAGFPGIPVKIVRPELAIALIEARERRASFLSAVIRDLGLDRARVLNDRAESLSRMTLESFDAVMIRCAGDPVSVLTDAEKLLIQGGSVVLSGPPSRRDLGHGQWIEVDGIRPGRRRLFFVRRI